jgi:hypothetical protein
MPESRITRKGLILIYIFILIVTVTAMALVFVDGNLNDTKLLNDYENDKKAQWLAFGGIAKGIEKYKKFPDFRGKLPDEILNGGQIFVEIRNSEKGVAEIISTGISKGVKIRVEKELKRQ